ncbi:MAG: Asp-tRNA(Asn)/Glu-tRNA(Gln) amidotransferase subunit GatA, partial [Bacilli bacterium]|nr:Asp-tRNA(Asn)/Glu-tRNA(Gln) amidotransferase subunit GatA [Bacilli bacterium]
CDSKMLDNFVSIYDAKVIKDIKNEGMIIIGKTNMDEFAMGSTSETSFYGAPINPWNKERVSGGSSGGSAVAISGRLVPLAIGSDTGGSVRQPASFNGIVGMKPTYGRISRYGLVAFASSLDQIGPMTRNVYENALLLNTICKKDNRDLTSFETNEDFTRLIGKDVSNLKIAIPNYFVSDVVSNDVKEKVMDVKKMLEENGCHIDFVDINHIDKATILYQIISYGEASSNLARFDGVRYGYRYPSDNLEEMYTKTREIGFGDEVKRRIMVGSYILSGENAKIYYTKALQLRDDLKKSFKNIFKDYDLIIGPTTARCAYPINSNNDNPLQSFLDDILVMHANMGGFPGMNVPIGFNDEHLPIGLQILGDTCEEAKMYQLASFIEKELNLNLEVGGYDE